MMGKTKKLKKWGSRCRGYAERAEQAAAAAETALREIRRRDDLPAPRTTAHPPAAHRPAKGRPLLDIPPTAQ